MARKATQEATSERELPAAWEHDFFFGHEGLEETLKQRLTSGHLHHAWLMEGMQGIGKATLAWRLARFLLAKPHEHTKTLAIDKTSEAWHLTKAFSHPDFLYLAPAEESKTQTITIDNVRAVNNFFTKSPALGSHRVVIFDAVDNMNTNAANGLLKLLEEPPAHAMLLLISHRTGSVLATLRSRCQGLKLSLLTEEAQREGLKTFLPDLAEKEIQLAIDLGKGSLGKALDFALPKGRELYHHFQTLVQGLNHLDAGKVEKFCAAFNDKESYELFCRLMLDWSHALTSRSQLADTKHALAFWDELNAIITSTERLNMDRKLAAHKMFLALEKMVFSRVAA